MAGLKLDAPLLVGLLGICGFGLVVLWSAGGQEPALLMAPARPARRGLRVLLMIAQVPPKLLRLWSPWLFPAGWCCWPSCCSLAMSARGPSAGWTSVWCDSSPPRS
jgi:hypothetical protein